MIRKTSELIDYVWIVFPASSDYMEMNFDSQSSGAGSRQSTYAAIVRNQSYVKQDLGGRPSQAESEQLSSKVTGGGLSEGGTGGRACDSSEAYMDLSIWQTTPCGGARPKDASLLSYGSVLTDLSGLSVSRTGTSSGEYMDMKLPCVTSTLASSAHAVSTSAMAQCYMDMNITRPQGQGSEPSAAGGTANISRSNNVACSDAYVDMNPVRDYEETASDQSQRSDSARQISRGSDVTKRVKDVASVNSEDYVNVESYKG